MGRWRGQVVVAYLDEPPFGVPPTRPGTRPSGCDMDLAYHVLQAAGIATVSYVLTTFPDLIPGLLAGRWQMTTPIFITDERAKAVDYSRPVWAAEDGFLVRRADASRYTSYEAIAASPRAVLAVVTGQVQRDTARRAGMPPERIIELPHQDAAASTVRDGRADAAASTAAGNRAYLARAGDVPLSAVTDHSPHRSGLAPQGAFAFAPDAAELREAVDQALTAYVGSPAHLRLLAAYGVTPPSPTNP